MNRSITKTAAMLLRRALATPAFLCDVFPKCFAPENPRPLKREIHADIIERTGIDDAALSIALGQYTAREEYLRALVEGAKRVDLEGNEVEDVTADEAERAKAMLRST